MKNLKNSSNIRKNLINNTKKNIILKQLNKNHIIKNIINTKPLPFSLLSQRNSKTKLVQNLVINKNKNINIDINKKDMTKKDLLSQNILIKAFSSNRLEKNKNINANINTNPNISSSKLLVNN